MNKLQGVTAYLACPFEKDLDCAGWREEIKPELEKLGVIAWDPLPKPKWFVDRVGDITAELQREDKDIIQTWTSVGPSSYQSESGQKDREVIFRNEYMRNVCLRLASACDIIICYVDGPTVGTFEELCVANQQKKPILFFTNGKVLDSAWRAIQFNTITGNKFFSHMHDMLEYLDGVNDGTQSVNSIDWIFLEGMWNENQA